MLTNKCNKQFLTKALTLINPGYFHNNLSWGGAQSSSIIKSAVSAILTHTKQQKTFQGTLGTQDHTSIGSKTNLGPSMDHAGPLHGPYDFWEKFREFWENFGIFYFWYSLAPLTMLDHLFGHCPTLPWLRGPSWTSMDPKMITPPPRMEWNGISCLDSRRLCLAVGQSR